MPEFKSVLDIANLSPEEQFHRLAEAIRKAVLPLCTWHQSLADKRKEEQFLNSLASALAETIRSIMAIATGLRALAKELPPPTPFLYSDVASSAPAPIESMQALRKALLEVMGSALSPSPSLSLPPSLSLKLQVGPRLAIADKPVADLTPNELYDEHARLCAERELGRPTPSDLVRLQEVISRIQYLEWGYEI